MSSVDHVKELVDAGILLQSQLDAWITRYPDVADTHALRRAGLIRPKRALEQLRSALEWGPSVGLFGESQCGKSSLVSRFAVGDSAGNGDSGELQIEVPLSIDEAGAIPFRDSFDPKNSDESTGVACRFTTSRLPGVPEGRVVAELVGLSDLITSLCAGLEAESGHRRVSDRTARLRKVKDSIAGDRANLEADVDGVMEQLRHAWDSMIENREMFDRSMLEDLDNGNEGWDEYVDSCIESGRCPSRAGSRSTLLDDFVSLLWDEIEPITLIWRIIRKAIQDLGGATKVTIAIEDVRGDQANGLRSLLDIGWINKVFDDTGSRVSVVPLDGRKAGLPVVIARSLLVALVRTLVLPVKVGSDVEPGDQLDVLDFPGARAGKGDRGSTGEMTDKDAIEILRRGKLTWLFHSAVKRLDASVLCLVAKADGNYEARAEVENAIRLWLDREGWPGEDGESSATPAMVVAVTKSDLLFKDGNAPHQMVQRVKALHGYSERTPSWMTNWGGPGGCFRSVYWVHNPKLADKDWIGRSVGDAKSDEERNRRTRVSGDIKEASRRSEIVDHTAGSVEEAIGRLLQWSDDENRQWSGGEDVSALYSEIQRLNDPDGRIAGFVRTAIEPIEHMVHDIDAIYVGRGDGDRSRLEETRARADIDALKGSLQRNVLVDLLDLVSISSRMVERAFWEAANLDTEDSGHSVSVVPFDRFYDALKRKFRRRFEKESEKAGRPLSVITPSEARDSLLARFKRFPELEWFRKGLEDAVGSKVSAYNPSDVRIEAVASIARMVWNRQMVWLGEVPPVERVGLVDDGAPTLQESSAASLKILRHWESRLATTYLGLVDPKTCDSDHNLRLQEFRDRFGRVVDNFLEGVSGEHWCGAELQARIRDLGDGLRSTREEVPTGESA